MVEIHAAGVNPLDSKIREGEFKLILPYRFPLVPGNEVAGAVVRVVANVRQFKPRDAIHARPAQRRVGTFAEYIAVEEPDVARPISAGTGLCRSGTRAFLDILAQRIKIGDARPTEGGADGAEHLTTRALESGLFGCAPRSSADSAP